MTIRTDVAIIGGGPGGATAAMFLAELGIRSLIIERDRFPRYHIGESMTGECGGVLRDLGLEDRMQQDRHPQKQGVKVYGANGKNGFWVPVMRRDEAGELDDNYTWQVRRSEFDAMMLTEALSRGAELLQAEAVAPLWAPDGHTMTGVRVKHPDGRVEPVEARVTLDISGQRTFFAHQGVTSGKTPGRYDKQVAIFSQVANTIRDRGPERENHPDNAIILYKSKFHWAWLIPLDAEVVSVGVVAPGAYFAGRHESKADYLRRELRELNPELARRVPDVTLLEEARAVPNYSYHCSNFMGPGWMCIGDAHRFIDPIFSFGLYVSMKEAQLSAPVIRDYLDGKLPHTGNPFQGHMEYLERGLDLLQDLIDAFWENPLGFAQLVHGKRYRAELIDMFAGRIYLDRPTPALETLRMLAKAGREKLSQSA